jgi:tRNA acetyltransferase TAN1
MDANLLVTYNTSHEGRAKEEALALLKEVGEKASFIDSDVEGVFLVSVKDARKSVRKILEIFDKDHSKFELTFKWTPIDKWVTSDVETLEKEIEKLDGKIDEKESWKLEINKRQYQGSVTDIIMKLTEKITKPKVDLKNPHKIIKIEIIGDKAGISLLESNDFLDVQKLKK